MNLEEILEEEIDDAADGKIEIPDGLPGSKNPRRPSQQRFEQYAKPEAIGIPKRRGRPPGSTNRNSSSKPSNTFTEKFWTDLAALSLNYSTAFIAAQIFKDARYIMTEQEAVSAASAIMTVAFKHKQFREFAAIVNVNSDYAIIARGFWPYVSRVFLKEFMQNVISRIAVSNTRQSKQSKSQSGRNTSVPNGQSDKSISNGGNESNVPIAVFDRFNELTDWRNV